MYTSPLDEAEYNMKNRPGCFLCRQNFRSTGLNANETRGSTGNVWEQTDDLPRYSSFPFQPVGTEIPVPLAKFSFGRGWRLDSFPSFLMFAGER